MSDICEAPWKYDTLPIQITDNLWFVGNLDVSAHILDTGDGLILFDTTYPQTAYMLLESIRCCGLEPKNIKYILHTHAHYDHIGATRMLVEKYCCVTFLGEGDAYFLDKHPELTWHQELNQPYREQFTPDVLLKDGAAIRLGNTEILCIASPGHTPGTMTFLWETTWKGTSYSCALSGGFWPNTATTAYMKKYSLENWRNNYADTFSRLAALSPQITLGAHPSFNNTFQKAAYRTDDKNPFIDSNEWSRTLSEGKKAFDTLCREDPM